jgi:hypothetical protein
MAARSALIQRTASERIFGWHQDHDGLCVGLTVSDTFETLWYINRRDLSWGSRFLGSIHRLD